MKKVLYFIQLPPPIHGAAITNRLVYSSEVINKGFNKRLLRINYSENLSSIKKLSLNKFFIYIKLYFKFSYELLLKRPKLVYYTIPPTGVGLYKDIPFVLMLKILCIKPLYHLHGKGIYENIQDSTLKKKLHKWIYSNSNIIHLSNNLLHREIKPLNLTKSKLFVVNNGVDSVVSKNRQVRKKNSINILFFSNITISKGILMALKVLLELLKVDKNIKFNIIGGFREPATKELVYEFIYQNDLEHFVKFHGALYGDKKNTILSKMDILLYPSFNDAYPLVILECLQFGIPIVASDQGAIPEMINNSVGAIFKTGDIENAFNSCKFFIKKIKNEEMVVRNNCKELFKKNYSKNIFEKQMREVILLSLD